MLLESDLNISLWYTFHELFAFFKTAFCELFWHCPALHSRAVTVALLCDVSDKSRSRRMIMDISKVSTLQCKTPNNTIITEHTIYSEDEIETVIVQELCESRGGRPGLSVLTSLLVSVDVKNYWTVLRHWSQPVSYTHLTLPMMMMNWCLMSSDVNWHIRDKLRPMPKHGSV